MKAIRITTPYRRAEGSYGDVLAFVLNFALTWTAIVVVASLVFAIPVVVLTLGVALLDWVF